MEEQDEGRRPLAIRPYPARDAEFATDVAKALDAAGSALLADEELGRIVQERLRHAYPNAVVRVQQPLARLLDPAGTVYAYRDGIIETTNLREDRLLDGRAG